MSVWSVILHRPYLLLGYYLLGNKAIIIHLTTCYGNLMSNS